MTHVITSVTPKRNGTGAIRRLLRVYREWQDLRRAARLLRTFDNRMLRDIGIERGDIDEAVRGRQPR